MPTPHFSLCFVYLYTNFSLPLPLFVLILRPNLIKIVLILTRMAANYHTLSASHKCFRTVLTSSTPYLDFSLSFLYLKVSLISPDKNGLITGFDASSKIQFHSVSDNLWLILFLIEHKELAEHIVSYHHKHSRNEGRHIDIDSQCAKYLHDHNIQKQCGNSGKHELRCLLQH